ncbi:unnamed protein product, partial [Polarella glacialis]
GLRHESSDQSQFPFRFVHIADTDRTYETFAEYAAVVFVPGDVEQMGFYEFYTMAIPIFFPADPGRFLWPRWPGLVGGLSKNGCGSYYAWIGTWDIKLIDQETP